jgi:glycosyltransferase involved in cell wall biosynthesis
MEEAHRKAVVDALLPRVTVIQPVVTHATGGIQRQIRLQTRELTRLGHRVALVQRRDPHLDSDPELRKAWSHLEILQIPDPARLPLRLRGAAFLSMAVLRLALRRRGTDVYHCHQLFSPTLAGAGAKALRGGALVTKVTASGTLGEVRQLRALPFRRLRLRAFRTIDRVVVLHRAMVPEVLKLGISAGTITVLPNAVEVPKTAAEVRPGRGKGLSLLWVGRMSTEKGLEILLEAGRILGARLHARGGVPPEIHLVGGGDPDRDVEPSLRRMAAAFDSEVSVRFHGVRPDPSPYYRSGAVFVLPSRSEGMSNSLLEAMAWGLPCVASDIPSNRFLVDPGRTGLLFRDGDALSLAAALERLHRDLSEGEGELARRLGTGARERVKEKFSTEGVGRRLSGLYREVARGS